MNDFKILVSTVLTAFAAFMPAVAQDKIITKDGDVLQGWNVEVSDKYVFYNTENKTDADIKRMEKDKVLMVKRQDGSTLNLYEDAQPAEKQAPAAAEPTGQGPVMVKVTDLDDAARKANEEALAQVNAEITYQPEEGEEDKDAKWALLSWGVKDGSVLDDGNIRISFVRGTMYSLKNKPDVFNPIGETFAYGLQGPAISVRIENKSDRTVYVDLGNSFFVRMGKSICYYVPSSTTSTSSSSSGAGVNLGSVANALGIGGTVGQLAGGVNVGGGSTNGGSTTTYAQRIISIPPKANYDLSAIYMFGSETAYNMLPGLSYYGNNIGAFSTTGLRMYYKKDELKPGSCYKYAADSSPINMSAIIAYSFSESCTSERVMSANLYLKDVMGVDYSNLTGKIKGNLDIPSNVIWVAAKAKDSKDGGFQFPK